MFADFNFQQMISAFIVLFAVIDIIGSIPIIINLKEKGKDVNALKATVISFILMIGFFYAGDFLCHQPHQRRLIGSAPKRMGRKIRTIRFYQ